MGGRGRRRKRTRGGEEEERTQKKRTEKEEKMKWLSVLITPQDGGERAISGWDFPRQSLRGHSKGQGWKWAVRPPLGLDVDRLSGRVGAK